MVLKTCTCRASASVEIYNREVAPAPRDPTESTQNCTSCADPNWVYTLHAAALSAERPSPATHPAAPFLGASQRVSASGPCSRAIHSDREPGLLGAAAASLSPTSKQPVHVGRVAPDPSPGVVYVGQRFLFLVHEGALQNGVRSPYTTRISGKIAMCV